MAIVEIVGTAALGADPGDATVNEFKPIPVSNSSVEYR